MDKAIENIESMFNKADANLNFLTRKLEFQVENEKGICAQQNPIKLLKKVEEVKSEFTEISKDVAAIQEAQKEAVDFFRSQLLALTQTLGQLETQTGCQPDLSEETMNHIVELSEQLGISSNDLSSTSGTNPPDVDQEKTTPTSVPSAASASHNSAKEDSSTSSNEDPVLTPFDVRMGKKEFIELNKEEFMSVSDLVRGRAKLEDVNRTFKTLWDYFKKKGNKEPLPPLTPKDMNGMGMRVTGATGLAKLKILRALKLCSISKDGSVKLLL